MGVCMTRRVLLDVDGVLADFVSAFLAMVARDTGIVATPADVTQFDIGASLGLSKEQHSQVKRSIGAWTGMARKLEVYPGAIDGVKALREVAEVYIVTSPWNSNPTWTHDREWWLYEHFGIKHSHVTHTSAKYLCRGDFLVDDKVSAVEKWQAEHPGGVGVVWNTPHNQLESWAGARTNSWGELIAMVTRDAAIQAVGK